MPLLLVLQRDSWLLLFEDQTSTWLSNSNHVTQKIHCNIFKYCFRSGLVFQLGYTESQAAFDNAVILYILGRSKLEWLHMIVLIVFIILRLLFLLFWLLQATIWCIIWKPLWNLAANIPTPACKVFVYTHCCTNMQRLVNFCWIKNWLWVLMCLQKALLDIMCLKGGSPWYFLWEDMYCVLEKNDKVPLLWSPPF